MEKTDIPLKVVELFAGVGGFRLGLKEPDFKVVWSNQWEPASSLQHASNIYVKRFGEKGHANKDIASVKRFPSHDLLVGGFPCQDYSVARPSKDAMGIEGKKGVLWWEIHRILSQKREKPRYLLLENVDRLLKSPTKQRGRDFSLMLASLSDLGYAVEWRVVNAADYGMPQRRRRIFMVGYHRTTDAYKRLNKDVNRIASSWMFKDGVMAKAFPVSQVERKLLYPAFLIQGDLVELTDKFNKSKDSERPSKTPFQNTGFMIRRRFFTEKTKPAYKGEPKALKDILIPDEKVPQEYYIDEKDIPRWKYLKGEKHLLETSSRTGKTFKYDEGPMIFPDDLNKPSRTIITGEGGSSPSRFKHVVSTSDGRLRRLTPLELERLNMFPDNHTEGVPDVKRAFLMGNAIVVGVVEKIGKELIKRV